MVTKTVYFKGAGVYSAKSESNLERSICPRSKLDTECCLCSFQECKHYLMFSSKKTLIRLRCRHSSGMITQDTQFHAKQEYVNTQTSHQFRQYQTPHMDCHNAAPQQHFDLRQVLLLISSRLLNSDSISSTVIYSLLSMGLGPVLVSPHHSHHQERFCNWQGCFPPRIEQLRRC